MRTIWKFILTLTAQCQTISMPRGGRILHVDQQNGLPTLWVEVDSGEAKEGRRFFVVGTGDKVPDDSVYIGSVCVADAGAPVIPGMTAFVWHVYEKGGEA